MAAPPEVKVQVGALTSSEGFKVRVIESPLLPLPLPPTASTADVDVGCVLSIVTLDPSSTVVSATPAVPPMSV